MDLLRIFTPALTLAARDRRPMASTVKSNFASRTSGNRSADYIGGLAEHEVTDRKFAIRLTPLRKVHQSDTL